MEARAIAAQNVIEYAGIRPNPNDPGRLQMQGEIEHEVPPIVTGVVDGSWLASVQQMQLGLRPIRVVAI
eukprot:1250222-Pyramimonas_sp.AAC.1